MPMRRSPNLWRETTPRQFAAWVLGAAALMVLLDLIVPH